MSDIVDRSSVMPDSWARRSFNARPVLWAWLLVVVFMASCWCVGFSPNGDGDDILKLMKIRAFLETGAWFDQSIPGILQPEPFFSHWPRLLDLPYALATWLLAPFVGGDTALAVATFAVPLLLLLPAIALLRRIIAGLGFERLDMAFLLALFLATRTFFEFAPDRIDYHNTQILFLLAVITLTFMRSTRASLASGAITALAIATSVEFALFFALVMAIHVVEYIRDDEGSRLRLAAFGAGLATVAILAYPLAIPPGSYGRVACDSYSTPHLLALVLAGAAFIAAAGIGGKVKSPFLRAVAVTLPGIATMGLLALLFPQCLGGPYAGVDAYLRDVFLGDIAQERSLPTLSDFVLSGRMVGAAILFIGAAAPAVVAVAGRFRDRNLLVFALFALLALAQSLLYLRCLRYLPLLAGPGLILVLSALVPGQRAKGALLASRFRSMLPSPAAIMAPGLLVAAGVVAFHLVMAPPVRDPSAATFAGSCNYDRAAHYLWPQDARVMATPGLDIMLLPDMQHGAAEVAMSFHTGVAGLERVYRFLDPATPDPRAPLNASHATHIAICALHGEAPAEIAMDYPFATLLMEGRAPSWLTECPMDQQASIRIYRYAAGGAAGETCPASR